MQWESLAESQPARSVEAHRPIYRSGTCCGLTKQQTSLKVSSAAPALHGKAGSALRIHTDLQEASLPSPKCVPVSLRGADKRESV